MQSVGSGGWRWSSPNSAFLVGIVSAAGALPVLLLSLYGGVVVDRRSKLRIVIMCQTLLLVEAAALWWFTWTGRMNIEWLHGADDARRCDRRVRDSRAASR